ncbi:MAG: hypothetical protein WC254_07295 [Candidatus Woesearchaeota archaeon]|jgi:hypothetical protein
MINPLIIFAGAVVFFIVILSLIIVSIQKRKKEVWKGRLEDKKVITETRRNDEYNRKVDVYYLFIKLENGTNKKMSVNKKLYESFSIGDEIEKKEGMYDPVKSE